MTTVPTDLLIGGALRPGTGPARAVIDPATADAFAEVNDAGLADLDEALDAAAAAQREWADRPPAARAAALRELAQHVIAERDTLVDLLVREVGKPVTEARGETFGTAGFLTSAASLLETLTDEIRYTARKDDEVWLRRRPHGVVGAIIPWNYPSSLTTRKLAPALAAGNAIVLKADEKTPLSALAIASLVARSGLLPEGLVNVVTGAGAVIGDALVRDPRTAFITMTGSTEAGRSIYRAAADLVKPVTLELGGNAPFIVLADADLDQAVADAIVSRHRNGGQVCTSTERVYVHASIKDAFAEQYVAAARALRVGSPTDPSTQIGPRISAGELDKIQSIIDRSLDAGATILTGGRRPEGPGFTSGYWLEPTVISGDDDTWPVMAEELFGPVTPIASFESWDEVMRRANASEYGLSAYVYTRDLGSARRAADELEFGEVFVNRVGPEEFNGYHTGFKLSGVGGDDGPHGLDHFFRKQTTNIRWGEAR
ncbi:aldehyde dehydrogenase family protein [Herbiconiux sp. KACC 21604]|uniref:aldehyde dehydrogenase family protein n=1 Tax=unclassified Herbiconiux TaxID=2618217 RepID=UPI0014917E01|nr:aldehyde dehydrogenase family protein [Herbiconiux sp. SALV-R1]QJU54781.1 aldehyde dehydrogenase family protein [Herbiconiux sp. SALV-R1]WPO85890.1 aldehyde dehydrogenase family protein [Herbiconiux sp. KACC 21604]